MVLSIIFLENKHEIVLHLSIFYEYQQFFQHRICFSIQPQLQLVNLHRNREIFRHKTSHMVLSIIFLEDKHNILLHLSIFYEYQQFFQHPPPRFFYFSLFIIIYVCVRLCAYISFPTRVRLHHNY
jgi:hypothetical protein